MQLASWTFGDTNWLTGSGHSPIALTNIFNVPGGDGNALLVDSPNAAFLRYNVVESDGTTNLTLGTGSLVFWFSPDWSSTNAGGTGPGACASLIQVGQYTTNASYGYWCLCIDPAGQNICFIGQTNNGSQATPLTAPIAWTNGSWHQITLTYSSSNSTLYLDGTLVTNGPAALFRPGPTALAHGFCIGSDTNGLEQAHGRFDDLATFNYPLTVQSVAGLWTLYSVFYGVQVAHAQLVQAPSQPGTNALSSWTAVTGPGFLTNYWAMTNCSHVGPLRITNLTARAGSSSNTMSLTFSIIGSNTLPVDVFGTTCLASGNITNSGPWYWLGQGAACYTYSLILTDSVVFLVLGTAQDSDLDGLTDVYELLVNRTDPNNPDSHGTGILDGWYVAYHLDASTDPYAQCPSGDGWTILQASQNGWNPNDFHTPPPPQNVAARLDSTGTNVVVTWASGGGPVTSYAVQSFYPPWLCWITNAQVSASTFTFTNPGCLSSPPSDGQIQYYSCQGIFRGGRPG